MIKEKFQVDSAITSPPYWGLRDYEIEPSIWDGDPNCGHNWKEIILKSSHGKTFGENKNLIHLNKDSTSNFCSKCGAWKGSLGLEPTFDDQIIEFEFMELREDLTEEELKEVYEYFNK